MRATRAGDLTGPADGSRALGSHHRGILFPEQNGPVCPL